jgi:molecular chaperone DnaJ
MDIKTALKVLDLDEHADMSAVQVSFRNLAKLLHPDVNSNTSNALVSNKNFKEIVTAYNFLKQNYRTQNISQDVGKVYVDDIIDVDINVQISFDMSLSGGIINVVPPKECVCRKCHGVGYTKDFQQDCDDCNGTGNKYVSQGKMNLNMTCVSCNGTGKGKNILCSLCNGSGIDPGKMPIRVKIPQGINNGEKIIIKKQGRMNKYGEVGDLVIIVSIKPNSLYKRKGYDLKLDISVSFTSLCLGGSVTICIPGIKEKLTIHYEAGTQSGKTICFHNKGVIYEGGRGKLYVVLQARVPKNINGDLRNCLKQLYHLENNNK